MPRVSASFRTSRRCGGRSAASALCSAVALLRNRFRAGVLRTDCLRAGGFVVVVALCASRGTVRIWQIARTTRLPIAAVWRSFGPRNLAPAPATPSPLYLARESSLYVVVKVLGAGSGGLVAARVVRLTPGRVCKVFSFSQEKYERRGFIIAVPGNPFFLSECTSSFTRRCALV